MRIAGLESAPERDSGGPHTTALFSEAAPTPILLGEAAALASFFGGLIGGAGNDFLIGRIGSDRIVGSAGHDILAAGRPAGCGSERRARLPSKRAMRSPGRKSCKPYG